MHLGALCTQLRAPVSFFLPLGTNSSPEKVQHFLVSQNGVFSTLSTKSQTFYTINTINFFSDSPEGFALLLGECAALRRQIA